MKHLLTAVTFVAVVGQQGGASAVERYEIRKLPAYFHSARRLLAGVGPAAPRAVRFRSFVLVGDVSFVLH